MLRTPLVAGDSDMDQLTKIFHALGTPTENDWPVKMNNNIKDDDNDDDD